MAFSLPAPALLSQSPVIASNVSQTSSIPACPSKICAPCYITAAPYALTYPGIGIEIQDETYTLNVTPHVKQFPNGSVSTVYETEKRNFSTAINGNGSDFSLQLEEAYTWIVPGIGDKNLTLTYPTTYIQYNYDLSGVTAKDSGTVSKCAQTKDLSDITLPPTADPSSLIGLPSSTDFDEDDITIPTSILNYLDRLPEVQDQFNHIPLTSCSSVTKPPSVCTSLVVSISTSCLSAVGTGNLSHTHCSEVAVTSTSTVYDEDFTATKAATTGPIDIPRKPAAYLTYSTLTPSSITSDSPADIATNGIGIVTPTIPFHKESQQGPTSTGEPDLPPNDDPPSRETQAAGDNSDSQDSSGGDNGDSQDAPHQGSQAAVTQPEASQKQSSNVPGHIESAIGGLVSKASASQDGATAPEPSNIPGDSPDTEDAPQSTLTAGLEGLWSAIQGVASQVAKSDGSASDPPAEHATGAAKPGNDQDPQQGSSDGDITGTHDTDSSPNAGSESDASEVSHGSSAEGATGGIASGGTQISQKPAGNGGTAEIDDTNSIMTKTSGSAAPEATANDVPVFSLAGQTLSPGAAVTFGGSHASELPDGNGVVVDESQTVHLSAGQATTLQQSNHEPMTISRSGSVFAINGETLPPGQQITAGQTTASLAQSSSVLYVNGKPITLAGSSVTLGGTVYTASPGLWTSGDSLGGYIYSGIGGSMTAATPAASGSSPGGSEGTAGGTTGVASANTGAASRSLAFTLYAWPMGVMVLWFL